MADQIRAGMIRDGLSEEEATRRIWLIDVNGLVTDDMDNLPITSKLMRDLRRK